MRDLDHGGADRRRGGLLEDDRDVGAGGRGPLLEQLCEADHRTVAIPPPVVGTRADHVHAVDHPAHLARAYAVALSDSRAAAAAASSRRSSPQKTSPSTITVGTPKPPGATAASVSSLSAALICGSESASARAAASRPARRPASSTV